MMLYYVETAVDLTARFGDIDENFYAAAENMFEKACVIVHKHKFHTDFQAKCLQIVRQTKDMGWGFYDALWQSYQQYFDVVL